MTIPDEQLLPAERFTRGDRIWWKGWQWRGHHRSGKPPTNRVLKRIRQGLYPYLPHRR